MNGPFRYSRGAVGVPADASRPQRAGQWALVGCQWVGSGCGPPTSASQVSVSAAQSTSSGGFGGGNRPASINWAVSCPALQHAWPVCL